MKLENLGRNRILARRVSVYYITQKEIKNAN